MSLPRPIRIAALSFALAVALLGGCAREPQVKPHAETTWSEPLTVTFLDVGQGDSTLLEWGDYSGLIDGGPPSAGKRLLQTLRDRGIDRLDWIIATHPHSDHIGGLSDVVRAVPVDRFIASGYNAGSPLQRSLLRSLERRRGTRLQRVAAEQTLDLGGGLAMYVFSPSEPFLQNTGNDPNNNSIVARLDYGNVRMLFAGDQERVGRQVLYGRLAANPDGERALRADVLKVAHHGIEDGTDRRFLRMVRPRYAVLFCETRNDFGHPHREVLRDLRNSKVTLYRTDVNGDVTLRTDGKTLKATSERTGDVWAHALPSPNSRNGRRGY